MKYYIAKGTDFNYDLEWVMQKLGRKYSVKMISCKYWDNADFVWKIIPKGIDLDSIVTLKYFNNFHTDITTKIGLLRTGLECMGEDFFNYHPHSIKYNGEVSQFPSIIKLSDGFGGQDIHVVFNHEQLYRLDLHGKEYIIQRYISRPKLYNGRKFDIRAYVLLTKDEIYLHTFAFARVAPSLYREVDTDPSITLTNICLEGEAASLHDVNVDFSTIHSLVKDIKGVFVLAQRDEQDRKYNPFDLLGLDIILDENGKAWLLEINKDPAFCSKKGGVFNGIPIMLEDILSLVIFGENSIRLLSV